MIAIVVGTLLSLPPLVGVTLGLSEGQRAMPVISPLVYALTIAGAAVPGLLSIMIPTRLALRSRR